MESELGCLPAEPILSASDGFFFRLVKDSLVVGVLCAQQVEDNAGEFVGSGRNRLRSSELARDAPEELTRIVFGMMQRLSAHAQSGGNATSDTSAFGEQHLAAADLLFRTKPEPGCEGGGISEPRDICTDLTQDGLSCDCADSGHIG